MPRTASKASRLARVTSSVEPRLDDFPGDGRNLGGRLSEPEDRPPGSPAGLRDGDRLSRSRGLRTGCARKASTSCSSASAVRGRRARRDRAVPAAVCLTSSDPDSNISDCSARLMTLTETLTLGAYFFVLIILAVYGWHRYYLVYLYLRNRDQEPKAGPPLDPHAGRDDPAAAVQRDVRRGSADRRRLRDRLSARAARDPGARRLDRRNARAWPSWPSGASPRRGIDIKYLHRTNRVGYKAGALEAGLKVGARRVRRDLRRRLHPDRRLPHATDAALRRSRRRHGAGALGPHQPGLLAADQDPVDPARRPFRPRARRPQPRAAASSTSTAPPASGGATAIADAGGWQHDTLTEDLDLSYRAQLRGWRFVFVSDVIAPAEVPVEMNAFKSQQHRWAKGSIQTCRKLLPRILRANLPLGVKAEAFFHLTANFNYPLMCVLSILMFPSMVIRYNMGWYEMLLIDVPLFFAATFSVCNFYMVCQREIHSDWSDAHQVPAVSDVDWHRPQHQQHARCVRGDFQQADRVRAHAEISDRRRRGRLDRQEVSPDGRCPAAH